MAKKIDRARIDSGRFELPNKLAFLASEKVDFTSITDTDGDWSVQLPAAALQRIVKTKTELKLLKASNKLTVGEHAATLATANAAHEEAQRALALATRKIKSLEKKLATTVPTPAPAPAPAQKAKAVAAKASDAKTIDAEAPAAKAAKAAKNTKAPQKTAPATEAKLPAAAEVVVPPAKVTRKTDSVKPVTKAVKKTPKPTKVAAKVVAPVTKTEPIAVPTDAASAAVESGASVQPAEAVATN